MSAKIGKSISLALAVVLIACMTTSAFAATGDPEAEPKVSNRYYFVEEKGTEVLLSTTTKTAAELAIEAEIREWVNRLVGYATGEYRDANSAVSDLVFQAHGYGTAAKIEVYSRTDKKYRVDSVTGKRTLASSIDHIVYKMYVEGNGGYELYKIRTCTRG